MVAEEVFLIRESQASTWVCLLIGWWEMEIGRGEGKAIVDWIVIGRG